MQYIISFLEGIITFISPCLLPMLPLYLTYIAGQPDTRTKYGTLKNALLFISGFSTTFVLMGAFAGTLGRFLIRYHSAVNIISGIFLILLGLSFLGIVKIPIFRGMNSNKLTKTKNQSIAAFLFGIIFSVGWTPCVGAFLGSALVMAARTGSAMKGIVMLLMYALGLGLPFLLSALLIDQLKSTFDFLKRNSRKISFISAGLLILMGILFLTGTYSAIFSFLQ